MTEVKSIYLKDYQAPAYWIHFLDLVFELGEDFTTVTSHISYEKNHESSKNLFVLDGEDLDLVSVSVNDDLLSEDKYQRDEKSLSIAQVPDKGVIKIITKIKPHENTKLEGLYQSSGNFCTQCEAEGFRRITYYADRPDVMAKFKVKIIANKEKYPILLSNGNPIERGDCDNGNHYVVWEDPFKKPCYLFALVAGKLSYITDHFQTMSGRKVELNIYTEPQNIDQCQHAMDSLINSMKWDEVRFGREYDLDLYNIVAVGDFNMGAMENKGLNIFNSKYVLAKPETATDFDFLHIESVIGHEYFHNWSGNRVTCRDWFQLSLKEGLTVFRDQEFTSDMQSRAVTRIEDVNVLRSAQFPQDNGPMAHPVRPEEYAEINNFYTVTVYNKGAEVIRMMFTMLGKEQFRKGLDLYFERHDGQAVTIEDFAQAMEDSSGFDLSQFKRWYSQAGTPSVKVTSTYSPDKKTFTLQFQQSCPPTPNQKVKEPFHIPVVIGLIDDKGQDLNLTFQGNASLLDEKNVVFHLKEREQEIVFTNIFADPIPSILRTFSAPVKLEHSLSNEQLTFLLANDSDEFNRWEAGQKLSLQTILSNLNRRNEGAELEVTHDYLAAFKALLLDDSIDDSFKALALQLPTEKYISECMETIDVDGIYEVRNYLHEQIALHCQKEFLQVYQACDKKVKYEFNAKEMGRRSLKNTCLSYLMDLKTDEQLQRCLTQFESSNNMTETLAALSQMADCDSSQTDELLEKFYQDWQGDALVVDKWLGVNAGSKRKGTLARVKKLMEHPSFSIKNPNKVYALIGGFCGRNQVQFHDISGAGYEFLADVVAQLDKANPQVAARMVSALIQYKRYDKIRSSLMKGQLERLLSISGLSNDVSEIVSKSLTK